MSILEVIDKFNIDGNVNSVEKYGSGHINETYLVITDKKRYILQKMNTYVFKDTEGLMNNIFGVTEFLKRKGIETLSVVLTKDNKIYLQSDLGNFRVYDFIENTISYQTVEDKKIFYNTGKAFGQFQNYLSDYNAESLVEVIPHFHDTPKRFEDFKKALKDNVKNLAKTCKKETDYILSHKDTYSKIMDGLKDKTIPLRVTHNDTKLNNILIDDKTGESRAIIDLDTIMPGSLLFDFGDSIRFGASTAKEDETDLEKVHFDIDLYNAYRDGFCSATQNTLTQKEKELMPYSAYLMTIECGMRFLADYLQGNIYFATKYPEHNLVRARTQIKLANEIENHFNLFSKN